jgi:hypothetical protein
MSNGLKISGETPSRTLVKAWNCASRSQLGLPMSSNDSCDAFPALRDHDWEDRNWRLVNTSPMYASGNGSKVWTVVLVLGANACRWGFDHTTETGLANTPSS